MPEKSIFEQISSKGPDTYIDGYGTVREVYEPKIIRLARKVYHKADKFLNGKPINIDGQEVKPIGGIGIMGALVTPEWEGLEIMDFAKGHYGNTGKINLYKAIEETENAAERLRVVSNVKEESSALKYLNSLSKQQKDSLVQEWWGENFKSFDVLEKDEKRFKQFLKYIELKLKKKS